MTTDEPRDVVAHQRLELASARTFFAADAPGLGDSASAVLAHSVPSAPVGAHLDELYDLEQELGAGGMGAVYRARDRALHRTVAVKVMHDAVAAHPSYVRRFYKEAQIAGQLEHPGIVPIYDVELGAGGRPRLAMRLIRGVTLEALLEDHAQRDERGELAPGALHERLELFLRAADAVQFAHDRGVVHRDLKPENIMVGPHRDAYVMDFGLATLRGRPEASDEEGEAGPGDGGQVTVTDDPGATRSGEVMGTVLYMPPEQATGQHALVGPAADQFALGMTLQEVVTLRPARSCTTFEEALPMAVMGQRDPVSQAVPAGLAAIIARATAVEPSARYASVRELAEDVRRYLRDEELRVLPDSLGKRLWRLLSRHRTLALGIASLLAVGLLGSLLLHVLRSLDRERALSQEAARVADQLGAVTERALRVNGRAARLETELVRLATAVRYTLGPSSDAAVDGDRRVERLSAELASVHRGGGLGVGTEDRARAVPLRAVYLGTADGQFVSVPPPGERPDFDPRAAPWYASAVAGTDTQWGRVFVDAGVGPVLPASRAVRDGDGAVLGVVGLDLELAGVRASLPLVDLAGFERAWLVDGSGNVLADSQSPVSSPSDTGVVALAPLAPPALADAVSASPASGQLELGPRRYLFARLPTLGWSYVVAVRLR